MQEVVCLSDAKEGMVGDGNAGHCRIRPVMQPRAGIQAIIAVGMGWEWDVPLSR